MTCGKIFQIKSKADAIYFADELRKHGYAFYYDATLLGIGGGVVIIRAPIDGEAFIVTFSCRNWRKQEIHSVSNVVAYIWKDRKLVNAELRNPLSEWYLKFDRAESRV